MKGDRSIKSKCDNRTAVIDDDDSDRGNGGDHNAIGEYAIRCSLTYFFLLILKRIIEQSYAARSVNVFQSFDERNHFFSQSFGSFGEIVLNHLNSPFYFVLIFIHTRKDRRHRTLLFNAKRFKHRLDTKLK